MRTRLLLALLALSCLAANAPSAARRYRRAHERPIIDELIALLAIPNVARDVGDIAATRLHRQDVRPARRAHARLLEVPGAPPAVYGELNCPAPAQTMLFYAHYDGQPLDPSEWAHAAVSRRRCATAPLERGPRDPAARAGQAFDPEWRLYARVGRRRQGADRRACWSALDALRDAGHRASGRTSSSSSTERRRPGRRTWTQILASNRDLLRADVWLICDGPVHQTRQQQIVFGARGVTDLELTRVRSEPRAAQRPLRQLGAQPGLTARAPAGVDARRRRAASRSTDFYDDVAPLSAARAARHRRGAAHVDAACARALAGRAREGAGASARRADHAARRSTSAGMAQRAAWARQARNVIRHATASASIELRLVQGHDPPRTRSSGWSTTSASRDTIVVERSRDAADAPRARRGSRAS